MFNMPRKVIVMAVFLLAASSVAFLRCWDYGMVDLDDYLYLTMPHALNDVGEGIWMPITWLSYRLDRLMFGDWYGGFHLTSIAIHAVNSLLVWWLLFELMRGAMKKTDVASRGRFVVMSCVAAAIWAVHPLRCESVVFLASRKDVLSLFFELLAIIAWVKGSKSEHSLRCAAYTTISMVFFLLGAMCKPSVMTMPLLCCLIDVFAFREVRVVRYIAPFAFMLFLGGFAHWQQACGGATIDTSHQPLWGRLLGACAAFGIYLRNTVWPQWLAPQCIKTWPVWPRFWLPGVVLSVAWLWFMRRLVLRTDILTPIKEWWSKVRVYGSQPLEDDLPRTSRMKMSEVLKIRFLQSSLLALGVIWFAVAVAPMLGVSSFGYHAFADRFTYIPAIGLSVVLCALFVNAKTWLLPLALIIVCVLGVRSWHQTGYWQNDETLFTRTLEVDGFGNTCAHGVLANYYYEFPHDLKKCIEHFEIAERQNKEYILASWAVYMLAMAESGRAGEIYLKLREFSDAAAKYIGEERYEDIFRNNGFGLDATQQLMRSVYMSSKLAGWIFDEGYIAAAEDFVENKLKGPTVDLDPIWVFLKWKYYEKKGERQKAESYERLLKGGSLKRGYTQFRYLRCKSECAVDCCKETAD